MPAKASSFAERQEAIRQILSEGSPGGQAELVARLCQRGFAVTQSSVSRDLRAMRVAKVDGRYVLPEALEGAPMLKPADHLAEIRETVSWVRPAGPYLLVAGTPAGLAAAAGVAIDRLGWPEVVGTIAGDDTLFIATAGRREQASVEARLSRLIREKAHV